ARLKEGPVICAEGYVFELERRGYLQAGAFVPEVLIEHPEVVEQLHLDFVRAGSDVTQALTYYVHREKLRVIGREKDLVPMNRAALRIAKSVARKTGTLFAGDICNTNIYDPADKAALKEVERIFAEQVGWAVEAGVDYFVAETLSWVDEALMALAAIRKYSKVPAVVTLAILKDPLTREGLTAAEACKRHHRRHLRVLADGGERHERLVDPGEGLGDEVVDPRFHRPADLLGEDALDLLERGLVGRVVDVGVADVAGEQRAGLARHRLGDAQRRAVHGHQVLLAADDPQLLAVHVVGERLGDVRPRAHEVQVQLFDDLGVLDQHLGHERAGLQVAAALELEHVTIRADDRPFLEARQQAAFLGRRAGRPGARSCP